MVGTQNGRQEIKDGLPVPRSALLFGPPGTSKTRLARAIAEYLGWPLITITPSEFLGKGLEQIHAQVDDRFRDLMDLRRAVVFFDEMDALAQTREADETPTQASAPNQQEPQDRAGRVRHREGAGRKGQEGRELDVTRQLLTTSMLPKLANLWDRKGVISLMATNHKQLLDPAITRPNRFDLLLCVAPPSWKNKSSTNSLKTVLSVRKADDVEVELRRLVRRRSRTIEYLDLFTVAEVGIFLDYLHRQKRKRTVLSALKSIRRASEFYEIVKDWAASSITLRTESLTLSEFKNDLMESRRQYYPGQE